MKKNLFLLVFMGLILTCNQSLSAQFINKMFFTELGGPGGIMSMNFDSRFNPQRTGFGCRIGAGFLIKEFEENNYATRTVYTVPLGFNYIFGSPNVSSAFEVGAGATFLTRKASYYNYDVQKPGNLIGHLTFMYRLSPTNGGFSLRVGFTPIIGTAGDLFPMGAIGFGYAF